MGDTAGDQQSCRNVCSPGPGRAGDEKGLELAQKQISIIIYMKPGSWVPVRCMHQ